MSKLGLRFLKFFDPIVLKGMRQYVGVVSSLTLVQFIAKTHNKQWLSRVHKKNLLKNIITIIKSPNFT